MTGIQKPLDISTALAKIIGTKKGEQVHSAFRIVLAPCLLLVLSTGFTTASGEEVVGVLEGEGSSGDFLNLWHVHVFQILRIRRTASGSLLTRPWSQCLARSVRSALVCPST